MVLSDNEILLRLLLKDSDPNRLRLDPFPKSCRPGTVSYGLSSYGFDIRLADEYLVFTNARNATVDPKRMDPGCFVKHSGETCVIPPNSFALGRSMERIRVPRDVLGICLGKSTYARCGILANCTPLEPEWEGHITVEISNTTPCPAVVYSWEGVMQVLFLRASNLCSISYADRKGRYQNQTGIQLPFVR